MNEPKYITEALRKMSNYMDKAREQKSIVIDWLEKKGIDYSENCEYLEDDCEWVYGIDMYRAESLIEEIKMNKEFDEEE